MGYYSNYQLTISRMDGIPASDYEFDEFTEALVDLSGYSFIAIDHTLYDECKWYNHKEDLLALSKKFPQLFLTLYCQGEDGMLWGYYINNGSYQYVKGEIMYEQYDPNKMIKEKEGED